MCARDRRAPGNVLTHEVCDDGILKLALEVDDVVREADEGCDATRIVEIVDGAAAAERLIAPLVVQLHGQTDDVVTLLGEQSRGDRRVDASRHGDYDSH